MAFDRELLRRSATDLAAFRVFIVCGGMIGRIIDLPRMASTRSSLPCARGKGWITVLQIDLGDLQVHRDVADGFVPGVHEALCFVGVIDPRLSRFLVWVSKQ
jgi:hypothetical protein